MCTKKTLYMAGSKGTVALRPRKRGGKLDFMQIAYSTDCVREIANKLDVPMAVAIERIQNAKGAFANIYREAKKDVRRPAKTVAREMSSLLS